MLLFLFLFLFPVVFGLYIGDDIGTLSNVRTKGNFTNLVVPIRFSDHKNRSLPEVSVLLTVLDKVSSYYFQESFGDVLIENLVMNWTDVPFTELEIAEDCSSLCNLKIFEIIKFLELPDEFDGLILIHSGYGAEFGYQPAIWSHARSSYSISSAFHYKKEMTYEGVIIHELGHHLFRLPDLYDMIGDPSASISNLDVMSKAWHKKNERPSPLSTWSKNRLGWGTLEDVEVGEVYSFLNSSSFFRLVYSETEYLLFEFNDGIIVYHIDEKMGTDWNGYQSLPTFDDWSTRHYRVRVIQKDNLWEQELNAFHDVDNLDKFYPGDVLSDRTQPSIRPYNGSDTNYVITFLENDSFELTEYVSVCEKYRRRKRCRRHKCKWRRGECF